MEKTKTTTTARLSKIFLTAIIVSFAVFVFQNIKHASSADCNLLTGDDKDKCEELEKKAKAYQDLIDIKNKQQDTLQRQLDLINLEQSKNQTDITLIRQKSDILNQQISELEIQIVAKENLVKYQRSMLSGLMQSYYEDYQEGVLNIVLINKNFSDILNQSDYVGQASARLKDILATIDAAKTDLEKEQNLLVEEKRENEDLKNQLQDKKDSLSSNEFQKQTLLSKTAGEEAKYQELLAKVEQQKLELFDFGTASNLSDVLGSVSSYSKPPSKYWDNDNFYYQWDSRWANKKIGGTKYLMKDFGCAVTSVAMAYQFSGKNYSPQTILASADFTNQALIYWPSGWVKRTFNSSIVDSKLKEGKVVIVHIKKGSSAGHFVVIHHKPKDFNSINDYVVHDPYFGANLYLGTSRALVGKLGTDSSTTIDQMVIY